MIAEEIQRRLSVLRQSAQDFTQMVNVIDGNFETRMAEIKNLELKRDKLREEVDTSVQKAQSVMQEASEQSSELRKEALKLLDEAKNAKLQAKSDQERATQMTAEAQALMQQAIQRQKEADVQYRMLEEKKNRILEAAR